MSKCGRCVWSTWVNMGEEGEFLRACVYILHHGRRRPCPPGAGCTVFEPADGRTAAERETDTELIFREVG